jgi:hypothetical protein
VVCKDFCAQNLSRLAHDFPNREIMLCICLADSDGSQCS